MVRTFVRRVIVATLLIITTDKGSVRRSLCCVRACVCD